MEDMRQDVEPAAFERAANVVDVGLLLLELFGDAEAAGDMVDVVLDRRPDLSRELWDDVSKFLSECDEGADRAMIPGLDAPAQRG